MKSLDLLTAPIYITLLLFYVPLFFYIRTKANQRRAQRRFFRGVLSILENAGPDEDGSSPFQVGNWKWSLPSTR